MHVSLSITSWVMWKGKTNLAVSPTSSYPPHYPGFHPPHQYLLLVQLALAVAALVVVLAVLAGLVEVVMAAVAAVIADGYQEQDQAHLIRHQLWLSHRMMKSNSFRAGGWTQDGT